MNPAGKPAEGVPSQGRYEGYPAQPEVTTAVQHTTVNISDEPPKVYFVWSLCGLVRIHPCCRGLMAPVFSIRARDLKMAGDLDGARSYATLDFEAARRFKIFASVYVFIMILASIFFFSKMIQATSSYLSSRDNPYYGG